MGNYQDKISSFFFKIDEKTAGIQQQTRTKFLQNHLSVENFHSLKISSRVNFLKLLLLVCFCVVKFLDIDVSDRKYSNEENKLFVIADILRDFILAISCKIHELAKRKLGKWLTVVCINLPTWFFRFFIFTYLCLFSTVKLLNILDYLLSESSVYFQNIMK